MSVVKELIRTEENGKISFGNYELAAKSKLSDFEHDGDMYKVKTYNEITKLERNGMFVYESVPGTAVLDLDVVEDGMSFLVEGCADHRGTGRRYRVCNYHRWSKCRSDEDKSGRQAVLQR